MSGEANVIHNWQSDSRFFSLEERIKYALLPPKFYLRTLVRRRLKKGEKELHFLTQLVRPGSVAIDIGANKGLYSWLLSGMAAEVKAFEPNPKMHAILSRCVPDNVQTYDVALSNGSGETDLILPVHRNGRFSNQGGTLQVAKNLSGKPTYKWPVRQERLDAFNFTDVSFIKIDVEGFELEVIEGARDTIRRERPTLLMEIDPNQNGLSLREAILRVENYGYKTHIVSGSKIEPFEAAPRDQSPTNNFIFCPTL